VIRQEHADVVGDFARNGEVQEIVVVQVDGLSAIDARERAGAHGEQRKLRERRRRGRALHAELSDVALRSQERAVLRLEVLRHSDGHELAGEERAQGPEVDARVAVLEAHGARRGSDLVSVHFEITERRRVDRPIEVDEDRSVGIAVGCVEWRVDRSDRQLRARHGCSIGEDEETEGHSHGRSSCREPATGALTPFCRRRVNRKTRRQGGPKRIEPRVLRSVQFSGFRARNAPGRAA
jgi:hypothetical protein